MINNYPNAGLARRLAALLYDSFLILAIMMISLAIAIISFNDGQGISGDKTQPFLYLEIFLFYFLFWRIKGQTLGMQVWKIKTVNTDGELMSPLQCLIRFLAATLSFMCLGLGFLWILFSKDRLTWHDKLSDSRVIYIGDKPLKSEKSPQGTVTQHAEKDTDPPRSKVE
ncbi:MAG: RDD family protein [Gammaproteobacteria bacterium]|nr:RDD family protein [Gammaproteobacteria bacterium]